VIGSIGQEIYRLIVSTSTPNCEHLLKKTDILIESIFETVDDEDALLGLAVGDIVILSHREDIL
jgi:hypothetical protein